MYGIIRSGPIALALSLFAAIGTASAETITVTISADIIDIDWQNATIEDLPGPDGKVSFSEAMIASNNTPGHQTVAFAIPTADWTLQFLFPGRAVLWTSTGFFFRSFDEVTIDGTTQTAVTGDTNPDGWEVVIYGTELYLNGDNSTLIGFDSSSITVTGSNGLVQGNTGMMNITLFSGTGSLIQGNTGGTIKIDRSSDNVVVGNTVQRVRVLGGGPAAANNRIGGPAPADRNYITGYGTWNGEGLPGGTTVQIFESIGTVVENNWIGTTPDGMAQGSLASVVGIGFEGQNQDAIIRNNRIAGILGHGQGPHHAGELYGWTLLIGGTASGITFTGNTVGLNANNEPLLGSVTGVDIGNSRQGTITGLRIGGTGAGEGNVIAGHIFNGITIGNNVPGARISGNSIYANQELGIDLIPTGFGYGVTPNDPLDLDSGGNGLQNFPEIDSATIEGAVLRVIGSLDTSPSNEFTIEFFAAPSCDASGFGEGDVYLGTTTVATDAAGHAHFDVALSALAEEGWVLTSTATLEPLGATSEFSACVPITTGSAPVADDQGSAGAVPAVRLSPSHPNPFSLETTIHYELSRSGDVHLAVYDAAGRLIRVLVAGNRPEGVNSAVWDGRNGRGGKVAPGVYFYRLSVDDMRLTKQVLLMP